MRCSRSSVSALPRLPASVARERCRLFPASVRLLADVVAGRGVVADQDRPAAEASVERAGAVAQLDSAADPHARAPDDLRVVEATGARAVRAEAAAVVEITARAGIARVGVVALLRCPGADAVGRGGTPRVAAGGIDVLAHAAAAVRIVRELARVGPGL